MGKRKQPHKINICLQIFQLKTRLALSSATSTAYDDWTLVNHIAQVSLKLSYNETRYNRKLCYFCIFKEGGLSYSCAPVLKGDPQNKKMIQDHLNSEIKRSNKTILFLLHKRMFSQ